MDISYNIQTFLIWSVGVWQLGIAKLDSNFIVLFESSKLYTAGTDYILRPLIFCLFQFIALNHFLWNYLREYKLLS